MILTEIAKEHPGYKSKNIQIESLVLFFDGYANYLMGDSCHQKFFFRHQVFRTERIVLEDV